MPRRHHSLNGLEDHRRETRDEADRNDRRGTAPEQNQEQRVSKNDRRRGKRTDPGFARQAQDSKAIQECTQRDPTTASNRLAHTSCVVCQKRCSTFSSLMMRGRDATICDGSGTMKRLMTPTRISISTSATAVTIETTPNMRALARERAHGGNITAGLPRATRDSLSCMPRLASSRKSCQICATQCRTRRC